MRYEASITAFDMLDQVHVGGTVWSTAGDPGIPREILVNVFTDVRGEGISDAREWLRDALVTLLEAL